MSAIQAWPNRVPLLNESDQCFVEDCATELAAPSLWNHKEAYLEATATATTTYLVNTYAAELYAAVSQNPDSAHVTLQPNMERHVLTLRLDHEMRSEFQGSKIHDVMLVTEQKCISVVRNELEAAMSVGSI